jgi:alginate O-acetyltransferase complex protein AlgI
MNQRSFAFNCRAREATSIIEFWRRWHMSLSAFLRDYLYIPLGGSRNGPLQRYRNLFLTMLIGGIWHGAGWTFIAWGALHGLLLTVNHLWRELPLNQGNPWFPRWIHSVGFGILTFIAVVITWVLFRAQSLDQALGLLMAMVGIAASPISFSSVISGHLLVMSPMDSKLLAQLIFGGLLWVWLLPNSNGIKFLQNGNAALIAQIVLTSFVLFFSINQFGSYSPFLYYQF